MFYRVLIVAIAGYAAYSYSAFDGDFAVALAALPVVTALAFVLLGPG